MFRRAFVDAAMLKKRRQRVFDQLGGFSQQGAICTVLGKKTDTQIYFQDPTRLSYGLVWRTNHVELVEIQFGSNTSVQNMWDVDQWEVDQWDVDQWAAPRLAFGKTWAGTQHYFRPIICENNEKHKQTVDNDFFIVCVTLLFKHSLYAYYISTVFVLQRPFRGPGKRCKKPEKVFHKTWSALLPSCKSTPLLRCEQKETVWTFMSLEYKSCYPWIWKQICYCIYCNLFSMFVVNILDDGRCNN